MRSKSTDVNSTTGLPESSPEDDGPVTLKPESSRIGTVLVVIGIAAFWNIIVSVFLWQVYEGFKNGNPQWFLVLFLTPFVLVGLALIAGVFYTFLQLFNPRPILRVSSRSVRLGDPLRMGWKFTGRTSRINRLSITLEGEEKATYQRGTTTTTEDHDIAKIVIMETDEPDTIVEGAAEVIIPDDTMHSFESDHNKIAWTLVIHGAIHLWPDVKEKFPIVIFPHDAGRWGNS
jgi:hypothetical protein